MQGLFQGLSSVFARFSAQKGMTEEDRARYTEELLSADMSFSVVEKLLTAADSRTEEPGEVIRARMRSMLLSSPLCEPKCGILAIGINGSGKTTTIAKLGAWYIGRGCRVLAGAGDTYRAAAIEQLSILAERTGMDIVKAAPGVDPASVIHDAVTAYRHRDRDVVIADTAGRLHTNVNLMNELKKVKSVMTKAMAGDRLVTYMIMDATIGKNSFRQAGQFHEHIGIDGIIITKLDGTAKGGIVFTICDELKLPVVALGTGEGMEDFMPFDKDAFIHGLFV